MKYCVMCRNAAPWLGRWPNLINNAEERSLQKKAIILCRVTSKKKLAEDSNYRLLCVKDTKKEWRGTSAQSKHEKLEKSAEVENSTIQIGSRHQLGFSDVRLLEILPLSPRLASCWQVAKFLPSLLGQCFTVADWLKHPLFCWVFRLKRQDN
jgi:hypothetical protein